MRRCPTAKLARLSVRYARSMPVALPEKDKKLVQIVDAALLDAEWRSGEWLICRPGCTPCCIGVFAIDQTDALRLQDGLTKLQDADPDRAARVWQRARESWARISGGFPGDVRTGVLGDDDEASRQFEEFADFEPCPALDPDRGTCDLYSSRPITCRVFGPPIRTEGGLGVCELCYHGATPDEVAGCELKLDEADALQAELNAEVQRAGRTIVAFALVEPVGNGR